MSEIEQPVFLMHGQGQALAAHAHQGHYSAPVESLGGLFRHGGNASAMPSATAGLIPFSGQQPAHFLPLGALRTGARVAPLLAGSGSSERLASPPVLSPSPSPDHYARTVLQALAQIETGDLHKVVLARQLHGRSDRPVDPVALASRLAQDPSVLTYLVDLSPISGLADNWMVGATPELLIARRGRHIQSNPLAGSARRSADPWRDEQAGRALLQSEKDIREHALVVDYIMDILAPHCTSLSSKGPALQSTASMWHLGTRIEGELREEGDGAPSAAALAAMLHPTPAVAGVPKAAAMATIAVLEPNSRGFYGGAIGWDDSAGDGQWYVALRCAEIRGRDLILHAGAGIVAGSDPDAEVAETQAKFQAMLRAVQLDDMATQQELDC